MNHLLLLVVTLLLVLENIFVKMSVFIPVDWIVWTLNNYACAYLLLYSLL